MNIPGLKRIMARRQPNSAMSSFISRIFDTNSVRTRSNIAPTPAAWAKCLKKKPIHSKQWILNSHF